MSATGVWNKRSKQDKNGTMKLKIFISVSIKEVHDAISVSHQNLGHGSSLGMSCKPHCSIGKECICFVCYINVNVKVNVCEATRYKMKIWKDLGDVYPNRLLTGNMNLS